MTQQGNGLEIEADIHFQEREWAIKRWGWLIMALIVLAGLAGVFGSGPLSQTTTNNDSISVAHHRFAHFNTDTDLLIRLSAGSADQDGKIHLWINEEYLNNVHIQQIMPTPESIQAGSGRYLFVFQVEDVSKPVSIQIMVHPMQSGMLNVQIGLVGKSSVSFSQFIYP